MDVLVSLWRVLPWTDWAALAFFFAAWVGYARFAHRRAAVQPSLLALTNRERTRWMLQSTRRDNRILDGQVTQNMATSPSFFASTTIFIIGGLMAVLSTDRANEFVREIPFAARTSLLVFDLKVVLLTAVFVYAFFRFTWSVRQYTFGALLIGAAPDPAHFDGDAEREAFARRAGGVMGLAAESFNDGLRAYYMSFAGAAWFFSPWAFMAASAGVVFILYRREFHSEVLALLNS
jgi:uncharacterized membrane protein